jgi:hypothetical protein
MRSRPQPRSTATLQGAAATDLRVFACAPRELRLMLRGPNCSEINDYNVS